MNQSVNDKAVCRTAPATPGLLIILKFFWGGINVKKKNVFRSKKIYANRDIFLKRKKNNNNKESYQNTNNMCPS